MELEQTLIGQTGATARFSLAAFVAPCFPATFLESQALEAHTKPSGRYGENDEYPAAIELELLSTLAY